MAPAKSTAPYAGPPAWLDAATELPLPRESGYGRERFVVECMAALLARGCSPRQAAEVTANASGEASHGRAVWHGNAGGWKITKAYADGYRKAHGGACPPWWKARGNVASADSAWCFYRAFPSLAVFLGEWLTHFVPKPDATPLYPAYKATGAAFWRGDDRWFGEMILVGYKGGPSKKRMQGLRADGKPDGDHPSVRDHRATVREVLEWWAQHVLGGLTVDGAWGPKSQARCREVQASNGLPPTGQLDAATLDVVARIATVFQDPDGRVRG